MNDQKKEQAISEDTAKVPISAKDLASLKEALFNFHWWVWTHSESRPGTITFEKLESFENPFVEMTKSAYNLIFGYLITVHKIMDKEGMLTAISEDDLIQYRNDRAILQDFLYETREAFLKQHLKNQA